MKIKIYIFILFSSLSWNTLYSQCEFIEDYNGIIATIGPNSIVGQSFEMTCLDGSNAFESITINHQAPTNVTGTLRIFEGETFTGTPMYEQSISIAAQGGNVYETIELTGGTGSLMYEDGQMYTLTFVFSNIFRWNGKNSGLAPARALWPNNGGTWVSHFDYFYSVGTETVITDSDGDGVDDPDDSCPDTPADEGVNAEGCACSQLVVDDGDVCTLDECADGIVTNTFQDGDGDGVCDANDVCEGGDDNEDNDADGIPDFCDDDDDNDGISDNCDTAPFVDNYAFDGIGPDFPDQWLCGNNNNKVKICQVPAGNPSNAKTICISEDAVNTHLNGDGGDYLGECTCMNQGYIVPGNSGFDSATELGILELELSPNPAGDQVSVQLLGMTEASTLTIIDQLGRTIWAKQLKGQERNVHLNLDDSAFQNGNYFISILTASGERVTERLIIVK